MDSSFVLAKNVSCFYLCCFNFTFVKQKLFYLADFFFFFLTQIVFFYNNFQKNSLAL